MARHLLVVMSNAAPGRDAEYNEWYTHTHLTGVLRSDGITAAQRFAISPHQLMDKGPYDYMAIYEIETEDLQKALDSLNSGSENMTMSDSLDLERTAAWVFSPCSERVEG